MDFFTRYKPPKFPAISFVAGSTRTRVEFLQESDVNRLVERFRDSGSFYDPLTIVKSGANKPFFGDFTNIPDYQTSLNIVIAAEQSFSRLPSKVRERFENDPAKLVAFVSDVKNRDEAIELGLIPKPAAEKPAAEKPAAKKLAAEKLAAEVAE